MREIEFREIDMVEPVLSHIVGHPTAWVVQLVSQPVQDIIEVLGGK